MQSMQAKHGTFTPEKFPRVSAAFLINTNFTADLPSSILYISLLGEHKIVKIYWAASPVPSYPRALLNLLLV